MNKCAIVFGANVNGNGKAVAERLNADGYQVVPLTHEDGCGEPKETVSGEVIVDMANGHALVRACGILRKHGPSAVVFADFFFAMEDPSNFDHDLWTKNIAINLTAPSILFREILPAIPDGGSFVVITSTEAFMGSFGASAYAASKAGIHNLVKSLANTAGARGIRVNAVAAGWIGGVMDTDEVFNMSRRITPLGRLGLPSEVGAATAFLLGPDASFVNGTVLVVDGGYSGVDTISKYEFEATLKK